MGVDALLVGAACVLYGAATMLALAHIREPTPTRGQDLMLIAGGATLCLIASLVVRGVTSGRFPAFGGFEAAVWYAAAVSGACLYVGLRHEVLRTLPAVLFPLLLLVLVLGLTWTPAAAPAGLQVRTWQVGLHVSAAFLGYGLFTLEGLLAAAYLVQDHNLKRRRFGGLAQRLPALEVLDRVMKELIGPAFALFSLSIGMGLVLAQVNGWGWRWISDAKVLATAAAWLVYALLAYLRRHAKRHGRRLAWVGLAGFAFILLAFLGVHLLVDSVHSFGFHIP